MAKRTLKRKFIFWLTVLIILISLSFLTLFFFRLSGFNKKELTEVGFSLVKSLSYSSELAIASEDEIFLKPYLDRIFKEQDVILVAVYNKQGQGIVANRKKEIEERIPLEVVEEIALKNQFLKIKNYTKQGEEVYDFYAPIFISEILTISQEQRAEELAGFARVTLCLDRVREQNRALLLIGSIMTFALIIFGIILATLLAGRMTQPIRELIKGVEIIGKGNLGHRIKISTNDEIEELGRAFNQMTEKLKDSRFALEESKQALQVKVKARTKELEELAEGLEEKVKERTRELQERINELERFHKLTVGRELKMVELKKALIKAQYEIKGLQRKKGKGRTKNK